MKPLRVIVADDEAPARRRLRALLAEHADVELVGECADGAETVRAVEALAPDALFLDLRMPGLDGFEVLAALERAPAVVFVSAHDEAVRAFACEAVDYLLKPFDDERFGAAVERARRAVTARAAERRDFARLRVAAGRRVTWLRLDEIDWIEAAGNYVRVHAGGREHLARATLASLLVQGRDVGLVQVHRSLAVRAGAVVGQRALGSGDLLLELADGSVLRASRRYRAAWNALTHGAARAARPSGDATRPAADN